MGKKPGGKKPPSSGMPSSRRGGGKLFTCSNNTCPNRAHRTPVCPNSAKGKPILKTASTARLPESSSTSGRNARPANLNVSGAAKNVTETKKGKLDHLIEKVTEQENLPTRVLGDGTQEWRNAADQLHRDNDLPAIICADGTQEWCQHGKSHRDGDQPAVIHPDGKKEWWQNEKLHRSGDQPAIVWADGTQEWWWDGKLHRANDLPAVVWANGTQEWWWHDQQHRDNDQPAVVWKNGIQVWYWYDKQHRVLGPAFTSPPTRVGYWYQEWWVNDEETKHPDLCEQACAPAHTSEEKTQLVLLCLHDDPVVAAVAAHNPSCPEEGKTAYYLKHT